MKNYAATNSTSQDLGSADSISCYFSLSNGKYNNKSRLKNIKTI